MYRAITGALCVMTSEQSIQALKEYFAQRDDVVMAFLFGSRAKEEGHIHAHSDWDIGVYFVPLSEELEYEDTDREYPKEYEVWTDCIRMLETEDIDLIVLNRAPATIAAAAIRGISLVIKDRDLYLRFMLMITGVAEDYRIFAREYYEIFERSKSLSTDDANRLGSILTFIESQMDLYSYFTGYMRDDYLNDIHKRLQIERWVENIMNTCIDIAKIAVASSRKPTPQAYREIIAQGALLMGLTDEMAGQLEKWVRLRNVLAHEYLDIKWKRISDFTHTSERPIRAFIDAAKKFLEESSPVDT